MFAFAGLADNEQFFASLREAGLNVVATRGFPDHHRYAPSDLAAIRRDAGDAALVTTGKDAVKIDDPSVHAIGAEFVFDGEVLERVLRVAKGAPAENDAARGVVDGQRRRKRRKNPLLERVEFVTYRFVSARIASMSEESVHRWGSRLGALASKVLRRRDRLAMANLRLVFPERPEQDLRATLDACWRHFGREMLVYLHTKDLSLEELAARCPFENVHILEEAIARGKGTILLSAHWGGWEIAGLAVMSLVKNVLTVARPLDNDLLEQDLQKLRAKTGAEVVDRRKAARALLRGLSENAVVVLLPDQAVQPREGVLVPFLGHPAWTTNAPAKMALRADASIVFAFCIPDGLRHRVVFDESLRVEEFQGVENGAEILTARINEIMSRLISGRPDLYLWMHDRWKGTPKGEKAR